MNGLQAVQNVVSNRTTLPILSNVLLRAEGDKLELTATDLDVTIACSVEAKVKKPGASTVPVKKLFGIVRELGNSEIDLEVDDKNVCSIRSGLGSCGVVLPKKFSSSIAARPVCASLPLARPNL